MPNPVVIHLVPLGRRWRPGGFRALCGAVVSHPDRYRFVALIACWDAMQGRTCGLCVRHQRNRERRLVIQRAMRGLPS